MIFVVGKKLREGVFCRLYRNSENVSRTSVACDQSLGHPPILWELCCQLEVAVVALSVLATATWGHVGASPAVGSVLPYLKGEAKALRSRYGKMHARSFGCWCLL